MGGHRDRRRARRRAPDVAGWRSDAVLRPGLLVRIVNIGPYGALIEGPDRLRPGRRAELQLVAAETDRKLMATGRLERCTVVGLAPLIFQGAIAFDMALGPVETADKPTLHPRRPAEA